MIIPTIIISITWLVDIYTDFKLWKDIVAYRTTKRIKHLRGWLLRLIGFIPAGVFVYYSTNDIILCGAFLFFAAVVYMFLFNGIFNKLRKLKFWFRGSSDPTEKDSWHEKMSKKMSLKTYKIINYLLLIISAVLFAYSIQTS